MAKGLKSFKSEDEWLIVMEDLSFLGFSSIVKNTDEWHIKSVLKWLANFHAKYLNTKSDKLWEMGTYWHLDTRPHELEVLEDIELKKYAKKIDEELNSCKYQTIIHGDAKLANFCFSEDAKSCAAVDFQYVGHGCGIKDVMLFISSVLSPEECEKTVDGLLDIYFEALNVAIKYYKIEIDFNELEIEWRRMYSMAWADFLRFIKGWSPNHFKINSYSEKQKEKALEYLKIKEYQDV